MAAFDIKTFQDAFVRVHANSDRLKFQGEHELVADLAILLEVVYAGFVQSEQLNSQLSQILERITAMAGELDTLKAQVTSNNSTIDSAIQLLQGIKAALDAAIAANNNGNPQALLDLSASLGTEDAKLAAAIVANTPTPVPPPPPPVQTPLQVAQAAGNTVVTQTATTVTMTDGAGVQTTYNLATGAVV